MKHRSNLLNSRRPVVVGLFVFAITAMVNATTTGSEAANVESQNSNQVARNGKPSKRELTTKDVDEIMRKHAIWLKNEDDKDGERADFSDFTISSDDFKNSAILTAHQKWIDTRGKEGTPADLRKINLEGVTLSGDTHSDNKDGRFELTQADLSNANLKSVTFSNVNLTRAKLNGANLMSANFSKVDMKRADLTDVTLINAKLERCNFSDADMTGVNPSHASLINCRFEPLTVPQAAFMVTTKNIESSLFVRPHAIQQLRREYNLAGFRDEERQLTYILKRAEQNGSSDLHKRINELSLHSFFGKNELASFEEHDTSNPIKSILWILFDFTCEYGNRPIRPLRILFYLIIVLAFPYWISIILQSNRFGIWKVWPKESIGEKGERESERVTVQFTSTFSKTGIHWKLDVSDGISVARNFLLAITLWCRANYRSLGRSIWYGLWFSVLSAFNMGWKDLDVGNWMMRVNPKEFSLQAKGWVKFVSGIQAIVSMYLLALTALTYFGRPFG